VGLSPPFHRDVKEYVATVSHNTLNFTLAYEELGGLDSSLDAVMVPGGSVRKVREALSPRLSFYRPRHAWGRFGERCGGETVETTGGFRYIT
jgi:hypothetical protein